MIYYTTIFGSFCIPQLFMNFIPISLLNSIDDKPSVINTITNNKVWHQNGEIHRDWLKDHPNPDLYFNAINLPEAKRVLWFLQN